MTNKMYCEAINRMCKNCTDKGLLDLILRLLVRSEQGVSE